MGVSEGGEREKGAEKYSKASLERNGVLGLLTRPKEDWQLLLSSPWYPATM